MDRCGWCGKKRETNASLYYVNIRGCSKIVNIIVKSVEINAVLLTIIIVNTVVYICQMNFV